MKWTDESYSRAAMDRYENDLLTPKPARKHAWLRYLIVLALIVLVLFALNEFSMFAFLKAFGS